MKRGLISIGFLVILLSSLTFQVISTGMAMASAGPPAGSTGNGLSPVPTPVNNGNSAPTAGNTGNQNQVGTYTFADQETINGTINFKSIGQVAFLNNEIDSGSYEYTASGSGGTLCNPHDGLLYGLRLALPNNEGYNAAQSYFENPSLTAYVNIGWKQGANCDTFQGTINISNPKDSNTGLPAARTNMAWSSDDIATLPSQVESIDVSNNDASNSVYSYQPLDNATGVYSAQTQNANLECGASSGSYGAIILDAGSTHFGTLYTLSDSSGQPLSINPALSSNFNGSDCYVTGSPIRVVVGGTQGQAPGGSSGNAGSGSTSPSCNAGSINLGLFTISNPLNWLLCGIIAGLNLIVTNLDSLIMDWLAVGTNGSTSTDDPNYIFSDPNGTCSSNAGVAVCTSYYNAWQSFEVLALGFLAILTLGIILAQAIGAEILDAYTIRKMLPRVVAGAIIMTISWPLMRALVILSNDLGYGVENLLWAPFSSLSTSIGSGATGIITLLSGALALLFFDFFGLLAFLGTAAIAVFVAFLVLVIRQIAIIILVIFSPIAMIAYALPNTQRLFRFWWDNLMKMLLMFPLIVAMITMGHIFAAISSQNHNNPISQIIAFIAYFGPYFAVPLTFRLSGSLMATAGGAINSRADSARGALRNFRGNRLKHNMAEMKAGTRFEDKSYLPTRLTKGLNEATKGASTGWKGRYGLGRRGESARGYRLQAAAAEAQKSEGMQGIAGNNKANRILAEADGDEEKGRRALYEHLMSGGDLGNEEWTHEDAMEAVDRAALDAKAAGGFTRAHAAAAFMNMAADGTAIRDTDDLARLAANVSGGDRNTTFTYAAKAASISRQAGRSDLAAASEPIGELAFAHSDRIHNKGVRRLGPKKDMAALQAAAWESGAGGEVAYSKYSTAKSRTIRNDTRGAVDILRKHKEAIESGKASPFSQDQVQFAAASLVEAQSAIDQNYGKLNNRIAAEKELEKDDGALDWYLDTATRVNETTQTGHDPEGKPIYETAERPTTNREVIKKIVGDRYSNMTPEQRKIAEIQAQEEENH
jgi:hypothetical protein